MPAGPKEVRYVFSPMDRVPILKSALSGPGRNPLAAGQGQGLPSKKALFMECTKGATQFVPVARTTTQETVYKFLKHTVDHVRDLRRKV